MTPPTTPTTLTASPTVETWDRLRMLQVIEDAERATRQCACGELMSVGASDDTLWLECPTYRERPDGRLAWLREGLRGVFHDRRAIVSGLDRAA